MNVGALTDAVASVWWRRASVTELLRCIWATRGTIVSSVDSSFRARARLLGEQCGEITMYDSCIQRSSDHQQPNGYNERTKRPTGSCPGYIIISDRKAAPVMDNPSFTVSRRSLCQLWHWVLNSLRLSSMRKDGTVHGKTWCAGTQKLVYNVEGVSTHPNLPPCVPTKWVNTDIHVRNMNSYRLGSVSMDIKERQLYCTCVYEWTFKWRATVVMG